MPNYAAQRQATSRRIREAALMDVRSTWADIDPDRLDDSFYRVVAPELAHVLRTAQRLAAQSADEYVEDETGVVSDVGDVNTEAFVGEAADGRPLGTLMLQPLDTVKRALASGASTEDALAQGLRQAEDIVSTEVSDAGRGAESVAIASRPVLKGYVRHLTPPSCIHCLILAGRVYRWSEGFQRHPGCDCRHVPVRDVEAANRTLIDPVAAVRAGEVTGLSRADERAILDGADPSAVVNAHRGLYTSDGRKVTSTRAPVGQRPKGRPPKGGRPPRLRPQAIYDMANGDRDEAIRLLRQHGYLG